MSEKDVRSNASATSESFKPKAWMGTGLKGNTGTAHHLIITLCPSFFFNSFRSKCHLCGETENWVRMILSDDVSF
jgi:hypothetical protein